MESSIYYTGKNLTSKRHQAEERLLLEEVLKYGPWRFNLEKMKAAKELDPALLQVDNIKKFLLPINYEAEFIYIYAENMIFVIWRKAFGTSGFPEIQLLQKEWQGQLEKLLEFIPVTSSPFAKLFELQFKIATLTNITEKRNLFPQILSEGYGRCARDDGTAMDLKGDFTDDGYPHSGISFCVFTAQIPDFDKSKPTESITHESFLLNADNRRCGLRPLPQTLLTDNTLGHWDLYWPDGAEAPGEFYDKMTLTRPLQGRNPAVDVVDDAVAIDFGTSSTVVAVRYKGKTHLVRIGEDANDKAGDSRRNPFENPTALQFGNSRHLLEIWRNEPFRPGLSADDAVCSHQARQEINTHVKNTMINLKTWARKSPDDHPLILTDGNNAELAFIPPKELPGIEIERDFQTAPLNPIELYAYYMGLQLNNQLMDGGRIFTNYFMTFPVMFEEDVKKRIMASFQRGLVRSLPPSLIYACNFDVNRITVSERANEPAAFAAAALPSLKNKVINALPSLENQLKILSDLQNTDFSERKPAYFLLQDIIDFIKEEKSLIDNMNFIKNVIQKGYPDIYNKYELLFDCLIDFYNDTSLVEEDTESIYLSFNPDDYDTEDPQEKVEVEWEDTLILRTTKEVNKLLNILKNKEDNVTSLKIKSPRPTSAGSAFGVFDFGGGTTDYAIGLYRLPSEREEAEEVWETVVDILAVSGDPDLGGEHLVHQLAFEVICANRDMLIKNNIPFIRPEKSDYVSGTERLFYQGGTALANTRKLMEKLRPLWESGSLDLDGGQISETFEDHGGKSNPQIKLDVDIAALRQSLKQRIAKAVNEFFILFGQAFRKAGIADVEEFHVILAGNSCRSPLVGECFREKAEEIAKNGDTPEKEQIIIHPPLLADAANPEAVSIKTGVALGLLNTLDGEPTGVIARKADQTNAPFPYTVGQYIQGMLKPVLKRDCPYNKWVEFGVCKRQGVSIALYTQSPQGMEGTMPRGECQEIKVNFGEGHMGKKILVCAKSPKVISFALQKMDGQPELEQEFTLA